jgi:hypothetical protein
MRLRLTPIAELIGATRFSSKLRRAEAMIGIHRSGRMLWMQWLTSGAIGLMGSTGDTAP